MWGQSGACESPVSRFENVQYLLGPQPASTDFEQRSRNGPNHVLKKSIPADRKNPGRVRTTPGSFENRSGTILNFRRRGTKGREIVRADEVLATLIDLFFVKRIAKRIDISAVKRTDDRWPPQVILVRLGARRSPRVEI
jgi:hypothetical protein